MKYLKLGRTGLDCSLLGFGTWQIGGGRWKGLNDKESVSLLQHGLDSGINIYDAAVVYGQYQGKLGEQHSHSLELLGKAFGGTRRSEVIICLKVGQIEEYSHRASYEPDRIVSQVKSALIQLKTDYIDICLIHAPTMVQIEDGKAITVVQTLQAMGMIRFIGYSFEAEPDHARLALNQKIDVLMLQYNLLENACSEIFSIASMHGVGMLVGGPLKRGYLCGRYDSINDLPLSDDYWQWNIKYAKSKVEDTLKQAMHLKDICGGARELRSNAIHHVLKKEGAVCVVGHRSKEEVTENLETINNFNL